MLSAVETHARGGFWSRMYPRFRCCNGGEGSGPHPKRVCPTPDRVYPTRAAVQMLKHPGTDGNGVFLEWYFLGRVTVR